MIIYHESAGNPWTRNDVKLLRDLSWGKNTAADDRLKIGANRGCHQISGEGRDRSDPDSTIYYRL